MSPSKQVQHFSYIHPLTVVTGYGDFTCDGCNTHGYGKTYRCAQCDYDLHDYCATCPSTLLSFKHPQHVLQLVFNVPGHICDICDVSVEGFYYRCKACDFDVHPLCTGRPQQSSHPNHGCGCECGHTNQGQGKVPRRSKRKIMVRILKDITTTVVTNIITSLDSEDF
ncbi:Protein VACUOLELESS GAMETOPHYTES [Cardamine amara subsp. amara]|uniref:Protein VACUOLELESS GAMETOPHYTES n=1 Tax=Cardamine amara subsp. amara TaxID=228776 RepID=A0ABD1B7G0_CARAN